MNDGHTTELQKLHGERDMELARVFLDQRTELKRMIQFRIDHRLRGRVDASDILQNTFLKARAELDTYLENPRYLPRVWLRILNRRSLAETHRRELARRRMPTQTAEYSDSAIAMLKGSTLSPSQHCAAKELTAELGELLNGMSDTDREILISHHLEQNAIHDVAAELGISVAAAMKRYVRAIRRLTDIAKRQLDLPSRMQVD
ncbi:MAG: sigma-70 family RNA polymerase sigma factor [Planctomycetaceae bacterium]|nr:sigma-70 family RNA polymerase sigma factor [Planctomycetaceae bacterium]